MGFPCYLLLWDLLIFLQANWQVLAPTTFEIEQSFKDGGGAASLMFSVAVDCCQLLLSISTMSRSVATLSIGGCSV